MIFYAKEVRLVFISNETEYFPRLIKNNFYWKIDYKTNRIGKDV